MQKVKDFRLLIILFFVLALIVKIFVAEKLVTPKINSYEKFSQNKNEISKAFIDNDYEKAQKLAQNAVEDAQSRKDDLETIIFLRDLARAYQSENKIDLAENTHKYRIKLIEDKGLQDRNPRVYYDAAIFYYVQKKCPEAKEGTQKYLDWQKFADGSENSADYRQVQSILSDFEQKNCLK